MTKHLSLFAQLNKYKVVILFPTFTVTTIYADYSHTQKWKRQQIENAKAQEHILNSD